MAENLKVTHYRNGDVIPNVTDNTEWGDLSTGAYCAYGNDEKNSDTYGYLYNWYAVSDSGKIAPEGWHVPTEKEWKKLEMMLGMSQAEADDRGCYRGTNEGSKIAGSSERWNDGELKNDPAFGESGFSALPAGKRVYSYGAFDNTLGRHAYFWSATEDTNRAEWMYFREHPESLVKAVNLNEDNRVWYWSLSFYSSGVYRGGSYKNSGFSVRLIRD